MRAILNKLSSKAKARASSWSSRGLIPKQQERVVRKNITADYLAGVRDTIEAMKEVCVPPLLEYSRMESAGCYPYETPMESEEVLIEKGYYKAKKALRALGIPFDTQPKEKAVEVTV